jgi:hypothetical protein
MRAGSRQASTRHGAGRHAGRKRWSSGLAGAVWVALGIGLCADGFAVAVAPRNYGIGLSLFWVAVLAPSVIFATVLVAAHPSWALREFTVAAMGVYPALVYRMSSPLVLGGFDEHLHERTLLDLLHGGGLFAPNPMLSVSPYYPGLELFTGVAVRVTGMPTMLVMSLVVLLCRLLLVLTLYHAVLTVSPSLRAASLVVVFFTASPQFFFFDSQFAYETMALTLGLGGLFLLRRAQLAGGAAARRLSVAATLALTATVVTHHATSWMVLGFLLAWTAVTPRRQRAVLAPAAAVMGISVAVWTATVAARLQGYLSPVFTAALQETESFVGGAGHRQLFSDSAGSVTPQWQRVVLIFYALLCASAALICGKILLRKAFRDRNSRLGLLAVLSLAYPVTLAAHYVPAAADLGDRTSTFLFFPLALSCSLVAFRDLRAVRPVARWRGRAFVITLIGLAVSAYLGGVLLGSGPDWERLPGPYLVSAEARTQDPQTLAAVRWAAARLPAGSRVVADRVPADLLAGQARLWPVYVPQRGLDPAWLYFPDRWGLEQTAIVTGLHIRYLYVDQRLAGSLPHVGFYFYNGEAPRPQRISAAAMSKFARVHGLTAVYQHGPVAIYDTSGLGVIQEQDGFTGKRPMGLGAAGDALCGALTAALILALRQRLAWVARAVRSTGLAGAGVAVLAITVLVGGVLFGLRLMPGPAFGSGALLTLVAAMVVQRRRAGTRLLPGIRFPARFDPLIVLGVVAGMGGLAIAFHAA